MLRAILVGLVSIGVATPVQAQSFGAEVRGGIAFPTGDWNEDGELENGFGFGANVHAMITPMFGAYAGWERWAFGVEGDSEFEGFDATATDTGFRAGAHVSIPMQGAPGAPFVRAGLFYGSTKVDISGDGGSVSFDSDGALGFEVEGGAGIRLGQTISFTPALMYRQHGAEFEVFGQTEDTTVGYMAVVLGLRFDLGNL